MGGDHHGHHTFKIPDWRIYTVGEHTPELLQNERRLKSLGLKDPWARNEAWRYDRKHQWSRVTGYARYIVFIRGFSIGLGLAIITGGARRYFKSQHGHGHSHGHGHGHDGHH